MMFIMSSRCWSAIQVPPECSVWNASIVGYWLCTVVCLAMSPPYPCQATPPKLGWLRTAASSTVAAAYAS